MAVRGVKVKAGEDLSDSNVKRVIGLLEAEKPVTKRKPVKCLTLVTILLASTLL